MNADFENLTECSPALTALIEKQFPGAAITHFDLLAGGRNNRVFRVETTAGTVAAKQYFPGGDWDRIEAETRFLRFCRDKGIRRTPRFLAEDRAAFLALHEWLDGTTLKPGAVTTDNVGDAAAFLKELRRAARDAELAAYPAARDACLRLEDFFRSPRQRLRELRDALAANSRKAPVAEKAERFLETVLLPKWPHIERLALEKITVPDLTTPFDSRLCFVSPSDFGFHNALLSANGEVRFVDFEYAGRDSVAKAIADFVCQPSAPPPTGALDMLIDAVAAGPLIRNELSGILDIAMPLARMKFCCIILNDFKNMDAKRRLFSLGPAMTNRLAEQLDKAREYAEAYL